MIEKKDKRIDYHFFHWGPYLYKTSLTKEELVSVKKLCSKKSNDYRKNLAGLIKQEYEVDVKKLFPIILPYIKSYAKGYKDYSAQEFGLQVELKKAWVNFMTKFESNPIHAHDEDLSFVIFTKIPSALKEEWNNTVSSGTRPGSLNFMISLNDSQTFINEHSFRPEVGDFFIFPSSLGHYVNSFTCEGERISVSGNLKINNG